MYEVPYVCNELIVYSAVEVVPVEVDIRLAAGRYCTKVVPQIVWRKGLQELSKAYVPFPAL